MMMQPQVVPSAPQYNAQAFNPQVAPYNPAVYNPNQVYTQQQHYAATQIQAQFRGQQARMQMRTQYPGYSMPGNYGQSVVMHQQQTQMQRMDRRLPPAARVSPMQGRMSQAQHGCCVWYGMEGCPCCYCGNLWRCNQDIICMFPILCCCCIPICFPFYWKAALGFESGKFYSEHDSLVWQDPRSFRKWGAFDGKEGMLLHRIC